MSLSITFVVLFALLLALVAIVLQARPAEDDEATPAPLAGPSAEALAELRPWIVRYVRRRVGDPHAAEDIAQEVLLTIISKGYTPRDVPQSLRRWAIGIARNHIREHRRARTVLRAFEGIAGLTVASLALNEQRRAEARDLFRRLRAATTTERWTAWFAFVVEGYTAQEIAAHEGISFRHVDWLVRCAREDLAPVLASFRRGDEP